MPRRTDISTTISCSATLLWQAVYADIKSAQVYHAQVNQDPAAHVGPWQEGVRHVTFCMPLNAPDWVKRMASIESVRVRETQVVVWHSACCFTVRSETTVLNMPGAARFNTFLALTATEKSSGSSAGSPTYCEVVFSVKCSAGLPWPLCASIENIMTEKAQASMQGYLEYCQALVETAIDLTLGEAAAGSNEHTGASGAPAGNGAAFAAMAAAVGAAHLPPAEGGGPHGTGASEATGAVPDAAASIAAMKMAASQCVSAAGAGPLVQGAGLDAADLEHAASSLLKSRTSFRWPSVAVSTYPQDLDDMLEPLEESARGALSSAAVQAGAEGDGKEAGVGELQGSTERWLSPTASFSASGYASDNEGSAPPPRLSNQLHSLQSALTSNDLTQATLAAVLQSLAAAVKALDRKVTLIASHLSQSPDNRTATQGMQAPASVSQQQRTAQAVTNRWGAPNHPRDSGTGYQPIPAHDDLEANHVAASSRKSTGQCCCWLISWAARLALIATAGIGLYWLALLVVYGPHGKGYLPHPPLPPSPSYPSPPSLHTSMGTNTWHI